MVTTSVRMPEELIERLEKTAAQLRRSKGWVINDAVREYVDREERKARRLEETREALADVEAGRLVDGQRVTEWLQSWGTTAELEPPE